MVLLHLSDIHFGRDNPEYKVKGKFDEKKQILQKLIESVKANKIKPDHIIVTGDVAWYGKEKDFTEALVWFKELLNATKLSGADITFCPGNHDVNRSYGNYRTDLKVQDIKSIDEVYQYEEVHKMGAPLNNYEKFCEELKVIPYHYPNGKKWISSYSIGYKDIVLHNGERFRIVSFNTALLSFIKGYPDDQMLIGQPQVFDMLKYELIGAKRPYFTIAIFHHAERFLHTHEICEYDYRYATLPLLRRYVDLVLCGHTETGGIPVLYKQIGGAEMLTGGAAYYSDDHANAYSMVMVEGAVASERERQVCLLPFTYSAENGWHQNKRRELPIEFSTINVKKPDFDCRSDFELVLSYDDQRMSIPMKCVSVYMLENNTAILSNAEDVCRNLDIICSGPTDKPGIANISINIASTRENSVKALLAHQSVFSFLNHATKAQNGSTFEIVDVAGNVFLFGNNISCNESIDEEGIEFLKQIRNIELKYDVCF